jgi:hypothetical protein
VVATPSPPGSKHPGCAGTNREHGAGVWPVSRSVAPGWNACTSNHSRERADAGCPTAAGLGADTRDSTAESDTSAHGHTQTDAETNRYTKANTSSAQEKGTAQEGSGDGYASTAAVDLGLSDIVLSGVCRVAVGQRVYRVLRHAGQ